MTVQTEQLKNWLDDIAYAIEHSQNLIPDHYSHFVHEPALAMPLIDMIVEMDELDVDEVKPYYSACVFALEICVSQLQAAVESDNKAALKMLDNVMSRIAESIRTSSHSLSFWLPVLNALYEVHIELSDELKDAYYDLASEEEDAEPHEQLSHLDAIRDLIKELSDLSDFDIAENFFAQSYAMPAEFFADLVGDLYSIEEGHDIALLALLHPKFEVRDEVVAAIDMLIHKITLSSVSLTRLQAIKLWYPASYHSQFDRWIKLQRKKGVVFLPEKKAPKFEIKASEIDGSGAQGIFIHIKNKKANRLCGLLYKEGLGIKDAWFTPAIPAAEVERYYDESFDDAVMLRKVDLAYLTQMTNHFLAISITKGDMPDLHLLEIQEELGLHFTPQRLDITNLLQQFTVSISPFTPDLIERALKHSQSWMKTKRFTESWFVENEQIDKLVNQFCSFDKGVKICDFAQAMAAVFAHVFEQQREHWLFHFVWVASWLKSKARHNERVWQDCLLIAHSIADHMPLSDIPVMQEIAKQTVLNSMETMNERRTHLAKQ